MAEEGRPVMQLLAAVSPQRKGIGFRSDWCYTL